MTGLAIRRSVTVWLAIGATGLVFAVLANAAWAQGNRGAIALAVVAFGGMAAILLKGTQSRCVELGILLASVLYGFAVAAAQTRFAAFPASGIAGLIAIQAVTLLAGRQARPLRSAPVSAWIGLILIAGYILVWALAPILAPYSESQIVGVEYVPWGPNFLLGTDYLGRDMLSRLLYATRNTIAIALAATLIGFLSGTAAGLLAATIGGWVDNALGRFVDVAMAIPQLIFALLILTLTGTSITALILVIAFGDATRVFRLVRAVSSNVLALDFVEAARLRGEGLIWIMRREVLPNINAPLLAEFGMRFCFAILFVSSLSFLGLGMQPPTADWGSMVRENAALIVYGEVAPLLPAGTIAVLAVAINLTVDWLLYRASGLKA
ncbi:ABC transporter permease [Mesorhizobium sp. 43Arga]